MSRPRVHVIYEHGADKRPFGSASIRLLRPLSYPPVQERFEISFGTDYDGRAVDIVILDRLWRQDATVSMVERLITSIRGSGARLVYALDDNFLELPADQQNLLTEERSQIVRFLLAQADQVWVTTAPLKDRFSEFCAHVVILPNTLDERLLIPRLQNVEPPLFPKKRSVIGMMGTFTHDDDLLMILPALKEVHARHADGIAIEFIGAIRRDETRALLKGLPVSFLQPQAAEVEYPLFMLWFSGRVYWDIALSPLQATSFNQYKSDIKFLDYCAIASPGLFSKVSAYQHTVQNRATGFLVDNREEDWSAAIENLLADEELRTSVARDAIHYLYSERVLACKFHYWIEALEKA